MLIVANRGDKAIQYAEISFPTESGEAQFVLSTLPVGESCLLLENSRLKFTGNERIGEAVCENVAFLSEELGLCEDKLKIQQLDGVLNITNISGEDISGEVVVYYKNASADLYYGGITYRVRIEGGIKADEIKQIRASHFSPSGSKIMFVTVS